MLTILTSIVNEHAESLNIGASYLFDVGHLGYGITFDVHSIELSSLVHTINLKHDWKWLKT